MALLSMNEMTTYRWSFDQDVENYVAAGIPAIGVWRQKLSDFGEEKGIELLGETGLAVSSLLWAGGFTGSDGRSYKDALADAKEAIRVAAELKAGCLVVYSGSRGGHTGNHARRLLKSALKELLPRASAAGLTLAVEPMHAGCAAEWTFLTTLDETLGLLDEFDGAALKLVFDTYHFGNDPMVVERLPDIAPRIGIVHLGDAKQPPNGEQNRCRLGEGQLPLPAILAALARGGYDGCYDVELMGEDVEPFDYNDLLTHSKQTFDAWQNR